MGNNDMFLEENCFDEAAMLMGKVNALRGIYKHDRRIIDAALINAIFGFEEIPNAELEAEKSSSDYWYNRATKAEEELKKYKEEEQNGNTL